MKAQAMKTKKTNDFETYVEAVCKLQDAVRGLNKIATDLPNVPSIPELRAAVKSVDAIGKWMSAALEDEAVCDEMKNDIHRYFSGVEVLKATHSPDEFTGKVVYFPVSEKELPHNWKKTYGRVQRGDLLDNDDFVCIEKIFNTLRRSTK